MLLTRSLSLQSNTVVQVVFKLILILIFDFYGVSFQSCSSKKVKSQWSHTHDSHTLHSVSLSDTIFYRRPLLKINLKFKIKIFISFLFVILGYLIIKVDNEENLANKLF